MSSERSLWLYLRRGLRDRWHAQRHEDRLVAGIPDVSYALDGVDGWLELKHAGGWRPVVAVGLTQAQALWLERRGRAGGGRCFVLVRLGREHLLFSWRSARDLTRRLPVDELRGMAVARWEGSVVDFKELAKRLKEGDDDG